MSPEETGISLQIGEQTKARRERRCQTDWQPLHVTRYDTGLVLAPNVLKCEGGKGRGGVKLSRSAANTVTFILSGKANREVLTDDILNIKTEPFSGNSRG